MKQTITVAILILFMAIGSQGFAHCPDCEQEEGEADIFAAAGSAPQERFITVKLGLIVATEVDTLMFEDDPSLAGAMLRNKMPGVFVEVIRKHLGYGFTGLARFTNSASAYPAVEQEWHLYWIGTFDFRYHFFENSFLDPTIEVGIGCAGSVDLPVYDVGGTLYEDASLTGLSIFGQAGAGFALNFDGFILGTKALWRFHNDPPPATEFRPVALADFQVAITLGFQF